MPRCVYCGDSLLFRRGRGWHHTEGGTYMMQCPGCGWRGAPLPSPKKCPKCGCKRIRDDHCALPGLDWQLTQ
jgi:hypothetical protein